MESTLTTTTIHGQDAGTAYAAVLRNLLAIGKPANPRTLHTLELLGVKLVIQDLRSNIIFHPERDLNYRFMIAEWIWIARGLSAVEPLVRYNKRMLDFSDDGLTLSGAYGPPIQQQLDYIIQTLVNDPWSRQAVMTIWSPNPTPSKDIPCTIALQFLVRPGKDHRVKPKLHVIATMRSSDAWLGLPYDIFVFSQIANGIATMLQVDTGAMVLNLGSSHLYEQHLTQAHKVAEHTEMGRTLRSPPIPDWPIVQLESPLRGKPIAELSDPIWNAYRRALETKSKADCLMVLEEIRWDD